MHINYDLFAEILHDLATTVAAMPAADVAHRETLIEAAKALHQALAGGTKETVQAPSHRPGKKHAP